MPFSLKYDFLKAAILGVEEAWQETEDGLLSKLRPEMFQAQGQVKSTVELWPLKLLQLEQISNQKSPGRQDIWERKGITARARCGRFVLLVGNGDVTLSRHFVESSLQPLSGDEKQNTHTCGSHICLRSERRCLEMQTTMSPPELQAGQGTLLRWYGNLTLVKGKTPEIRA